MKCTRSPYIQPAIFHLEVMPLQRDIIVLHGTVVRSTSQSYGDSKISWVGTPKQLNRLTKFGVADYVGDDSPHAKTQNRRYTQWLRQGSRTSAGPLARAHLTHA